MNTIESKRMKTLMNFTFGAILAVFALGPAGWADLNQAVHAGASEVAVIGTPAPLARAVAMVRSTFLLTS